MENQTDSVVTDWCELWIDEVYLYGYLIPAIILFIFGLTFNSISLHYFATSKNFRRSPYCYYFSTIAVVDLIRLILWSLFHCLDYYIFKLNLHPFECQTQVYAESVASSISAWLTVSLTAERCFVIYRPLKTVTNMRAKRAKFVIYLVIFISCFVNCLFLRPDFYTDRIYNEKSHNIICFYDPLTKTNETKKSIFNEDFKLRYIYVMITIRVVIPFMLLLTANIIIFINIGKRRVFLFKSDGTSIVRHGQHRQVTPMIFFSSFILLLTISPRYLLQLYVNYFRKGFSCPLIYFAPHLLKTIELFNYSFNVIVSIISGKHGRHELVKILFCRVTKFRMNFDSSITNHRTLSLKNLENHSRNEKKLDETVHLTEKPLISNHSCSSSFLSSVK